MVDSLGRRQIGLCSWSVRPKTPADLITSMEWIGLRACQIALVPLVEDSRHWRHGIESIQTAGYEILSGMLALHGEDYSTLESIRRTGGVANDETWERNTILADTVAGFAADHGINLVSFHAGFIPEHRDDPQRGIVLDRIRRIGECFQKRNLEVALETGQETAPTLLEALDELDAEHIGVNFDPGNMILYGKGDPVESLKLLADRVRQIHIKDAQPATEPGAWGTEVAIGRGAVDWRAFFNVVADLPRSVNLIIERESGNAREDDVALAFRMLEKYRDTLGV